MASNIDPDIPPFGNPTTAGVRANFLQAKQEIEVLQSSHGFFNYHDLATQTTPLTVVAGVWKKITNDAAGVRTHHRPPLGTTKIWNTVTNQFDFTEFPIDTTFDGRFDLEITTSGVNQVVNLSAFFGIGSPGGEQEFPILTSAHFKDAGTFKLNTYNGMFLPTADIRNYPAELRLLSDGNATVKVGDFWMRPVLPT